jgi:DNA mismatch repair protein MSH6
VQDLISHPEIETSFNKIVSGIPDLERIVSRVHAKSCSIKDFLKVLSAFEDLSKGLANLAEMSEDFDNKSVLGLLRQAPDLKKNVKRVKSFFNGEFNDLNFIQRILTIVITISPGRSTRSELRRC